ncbi:Cyanovirin-N [Aulographum hederae CBS 113979]|uniref:Cyanovirin-N n=1 Tax=Aulographum hederae CBS 113979 TaxID=1176131 RepID=A0A6G1GLQ1_9PEZI|nr:Cyanovirin-N [Aulographum hederae CBS 113979]
MGFSRSSSSLSLSLDGILKATCSRMDGLSLNESSINLNLYLGNSNGRFSFYDHNFTKTVKDVCLKGSKLHALLRTVDGKWEPASFDLNSSTANADGELEMCVSFSSGAVDLLHGETLAEIIRSGS